MNYTIPFQTIKLRDDLSCETSVNRIFGAPSFLSIDEWPRSGNRLQHHILSIDLSRFPGFLGNNQKYLAIFLPIGELETGNNAFTVVTKEKINKIITKLPAEYLPWWYKDDKKSSLYEQGVPFSLEDDFIFTKEQIAEISKNDIEVDELEESEKIYKYIDKYSYAGGFPVMFQADQIPADENNIPCQFVLEINGFVDPFIYSLLWETAFYCFTDRKGNFKWLIQTD